jgi:hypothetical protein
MNLPHEGTPFGYHAGAQEDESMDALACRQLYKIQFALKDRVFPGRCHYVHGCDGALLGLWMMKGVLECAWVSPIKLD